tara:strand:+ start:1914 stop:2096 length:183 start_codon:yes stop_codon:yes gene_type:complete
MKKGKKIPLLKKDKHNKIVNDFETTKSRHLEKQATKMLKKDEQFQKLKEKKINTNFLNLF